MSNDEFLKRLEEFVKGVNSKNCKKEYTDANFIILDKRYFTLKNNEYTFNEDFIEIAKKSKMLFIADNPGLNENKNQQYLFCLLTADWLAENHRTAGAKMNKLREKLDLKEEEIIFFNKCLTFTPITSKLSKEDIVYTSNEVIDFIDIIISYNSDIQVVFSGITGVKDGKSKFELIHHQFMNKTNVYIAKHITRGILKYGDLVCQVDQNGKISQEQFIDFLRDLKKKLLGEGYKDGDNGDDDDGPLPTLVPV